MRNILLCFWDSSGCLNSVCVSCSSLSFLCIYANVLQISIQGIHSQLSVPCIKHCIYYCVLVNGLELLSYAPLQIPAFVFHSTKGGARDSSTDRFLLLRWDFYILLPSPPFQDIWLSVLFTLPQIIKEIPFLIFVAIPFIDLGFDYISQCFSCMSCSAIF